MYTNNTIKGHEFKLVEYRNGYYQGDLINGKKDGKGIYYFDTGQVYIGNWKQDFMEGQGVFYFSDGGFFSGNFSKNKSHDTGVYQNPEGNFLYVGNYKYGQLIDKYYKYDLQEKILETYENQKKISSEQMDMDQQMIPDLKVKFREIFQTFQKQKNSNRDFAIVEFKDNSWYVGLISQHMKPEGIGILHNSQDQPITRGYFKGKQLQGFGRKILDNKSIHDGIFVNDQINMGIKYDKLLNKYEYGSFNKVGIKIKQSGKGLPTELLRCFKHPNSLAQKRIDRAINNTVLDLKQFDTIDKPQYNIKKRSNTVQQLNSIQNNNINNNNSNTDSKINAPMLISFGPQANSLNLAQNNPIFNNNSNHEPENFQNDTKKYLNTDNTDSNNNFNNKQQSNSQMSLNKLYNNLNQNNHSTKDSSISNHLSKQFGNFNNNNNQNINQQTNFQNINPLNNFESNGDSNSNSGSTYLSNKNNNNIDVQKMNSNNQPNTPRFDHLQNNNLQQNPLLSNINLQEYPFKIEFQQTEEDADEDDINDIQKEVIKSQMENDKYGTQLLKDLDNEEESMDDINIQDTNINNNFELQMQQQFQQFQQQQQLQQQQQQQNQYQQNNNLNQQKQQQFQLQQQQFQQNNFNNNNNYNKIMNQFHQMNLNQNQNQNQIPFPQINNNIFNNNNNNNLQNNNQQNIQPDYIPSHTQSQSYDTQIPDILSEGEPLSHKIKSISNRKPSFNNQQQNYQNNSINTQNQSQQQPNNFSYFNTNNNNNQQLQDNPNLNNIQYNILNKINKSLNPQTSQNSQKSGKNVLSQNQQLLPQLLQNQENQYQSKINQSTQNNLYSEQDLNTNNNNNQQNMNFEESQFNNNNYNNFSNNNNSNNFFTPNRNTLQNTYLNNLQETNATTPPQSQNYQIQALNMQKIKNMMNNNNNYNQNVLNSNSSNQNLKKNNSNNFFNPTHNTSQSVTSFRIPINQQKLNVNNSNNNIAQSYQQSNRSLYITNNNSNSQNKIHSIKQDVLNSTLTNIQNLNVSQNGLSNIKKRRDRLPIFSPMRKINTELNETQIAAYEQQFGNLSAKKQSQTTSKKNRSVTTLTGFKQPFQNSYNNINNNNSPFQYDRQINNHENQTSTFSYNDNNY